MNYHHPNLSYTVLNPLYSDQNTEEKARDLFLEGVEHEQNGDLFEAIQKYRKAVNLVPDIENKVEEQRCRNDNSIRSKEKEVGK